MTSLRMILNPSEDEIYKRNCENGEASDAPCSSTAVRGKKRTREDQAGPKTQATIKNSTFFGLSRTTMSHLNEDDYERPQNYTGQQTQGISSAHVDTSFPHQGYPYSTSQRLQSCTEERYRNPSVFRADWPLKDTSGETGLFPAGAVRRSDNHSTNVDPSSNRTRLLQSSTLLPLPDSPTPSTTRPINQSQPLELAKVPRSQPSLVTPLPGVQAILCPRQNKCLPSGSVIADGTLNTLSNFNEEVTYQGLNGFKHANLQPCHMFFGRMLGLEDATEDCGVSSIVHTRLLPVPSTPVASKKSAPSPTDEISLGLDSGLDKPPTPLDLLPVPGQIASPHSRGALFETAVTSLGNGSAPRSGLETVRPTSREEMKQDCLTYRTKSADDARAAIISALSKVQGKQGDHDNNCIIVGSSVTIWLQMSNLGEKIFDIPVRGPDCKHLQVFDFDSFLDSQSCGGNNDSNVKNLVTHKKEWKCPICGADAEPHLLVADGLLVEIRADLEKKQMLHTKAVIIERNGSWRVKPA